MGWYGGEGIGLGDPPLIVLGGEVEQGCKEAVYNPYSPPQIVLVGVLSVLVESRKVEGLGTFSVNKLVV